MTKSDTESELVFVYGTLRRGASNAFRMEGAEFVACGEIAGMLFRVSWYPGLVLGPDAGRVAGDLFRLSPAKLRELDEYEGLAADEVEGSEYRRVRTAVLALDGSGRSWEAWVWEWTGPVDRDKIIASGDWMDVERPRQAPWFTVIAGMCLLAFPVCLFMAVDMGSHRSLMESLMAGMANLGAVLAPFAAMFAVYLAGGRRERGKGIRAMIFACAFAAGILNIAGAILWFMNAGS